MAPRHLALTAVAAAIACGSGGSGGAPGAGATSGGAHSGHVVAGGVAAVVRSGPAWAIQLASLIDSAAAASLHDSLARAGWSPIVQRTIVERVVRWRVLALPTHDRAQATLATEVLRSEGHDALVVAVDSTAGGAALDSRVLPVNTRTHGMSAQVRWAFSPDRRAMLVVEDPVAVEADPVPDGFVLADERSGAMWQCDGVWDVAPSTDWERLAYARAYVVDGARDEHVPATRWTPVAARTPAWLRRDLARGDTSASRLAQSLSTRSFPVSGMSYARGAAVTTVASVPALARGDTGCAAPEQGGVRVGGWRVGWTAGGDTLAVGAAPLAVRDDAPSPAYVLVAPRAGGDSLGFAPRSRVAPVQWIDGPTLDISVALDLRAPRSFTATSRRVTGDAGWIRVERRGSPGPARIVGPGLPLATTADGRFIAALAPRPDGPPHESPTILVVYQAP